MLQKSTLISATVGVVWGALLASTCAYFITRSKPEEPFSYLPKIETETATKPQRTSPTTREPFSLIPILEEETPENSTKKAAPTPLLVKNAKMTSSGLRLTFSTLRHVNLDCKRDLQITPEVKHLSVSPGYSWDNTVLYVSGDFLPETEYTVTIKDSVKSVAGEQLIGGATFTVKSLPVRPHISFLSSLGQMALTPNTSLPLTYTACDKVEIEVWKAFHTNLIHYGQSQWHDELLELQTQHIITLPRKNVPQNTLLPVYDLVKGEPGVYRFRVRTLAKEGDYSYNASECYVILSNIGATYAYDYQNLPIVTLQTLTDGTPIAGATVSVYDNKHQLVASGISDAAGIAKTTLTPEASVRKGPYELNRIIIVSQTGDTTLMDINHTTHRGYDFVEETPPSFPAAIWPDRDAIHPGEKVQLYGIVRDATLNAVGNLPLTLEVHSPARRLFLTDTATSNQDGYFTTAFTIPEGVRDGYYTVYCKLGKETIASTDLYVADFTPNHVQISLDFTDDSKSDTIPLKLTAKTYFGTPVAQGNGTYTITAGPAPLPEAWAGWTVGTNESDAKIASASFKKDSLDETIPLTSASKTDLPIKNAPVRLTATVSFSEPNSRAVSDSASVTLSPKDTYLAMRHNDDAETVEFRQFVQKGPATEVTVQQFTLSQHISSYELVNEDNRWRRKWVTHEKKVNLDGENPAFDPSALTLSQGTATKSLKHLKPGYYSLTATLSNGTQTKLSFWHHHAWKGEHLGHPSNLTFTADQYDYKPGETAHLTFHAPIAGRVIVTGGDSRLQHALAFDVEAGETTFPIQIPETTTHGSWTAGITLLPKDINKDSRYFGVAELAIDHSDKQLSLTLETPKVARPQESITLNLTLTTAAGEPCRGTVAIFAVDEAVLNVTGFQTPTPHEDLYSNEGTSFHFGDIYGSILQQLRILPDGRIGGGKLLQSRRNFDDSVNVKQLTTTLILPLQTIDASGKLSLPVQLPDFKGTLRFMAVAADEHFTGSSSTQVIVRTPATLSIAGVRYGCAGDQAETTFRIINHDLPTSAYTLTVGEHTFTGEIATGATLYHTVSLPAGDVSATLTIGEFTTSATQSVTLQAEVPMHAEVRIKTLQEGDTLPENAERLPSMGAIRDIALDWLTDYPYACTEQLSACTLPYITSQDPKAQFIVKSNINRLATRLSPTGTFRLWDDSFYYSPVASLFASQVFIEGNQAGLPLKEVLPNILTALYQIASATNPTERDIAAYAAFLLGEAGAHKHAVHAARNLLVTNDKDAAGFVAAATLVFCGAADEGAPKMKAYLAANPFPKPLFSTHMGDTAAQAMTLYFAIRAGVITESEIETRFVDLVANEWNTTQTCLWVARALQLCEHLDVGTRYRYLVPTSTLRKDAPIRVTKEIVDREGNPVTTLKHGDLAFVVIRVQHPRDCNNFVLCDRLPGGLEYEDAHLATRESATLPNWTKEKRRFHVISQQNTGAQVRFFGSDYEKDFIHVYPVRAATKGTFAIPAALIEDMYDPSYKGGHDPVETLTIQ